MRENIAVSVIIPLYNMVAFVDVCLQSVCTQSLNNIEIIVVDDCSTDGSKEVVSEWQRKDSRVLLINMQENAGAGAARNAGIACANGIFCTFMDPDDFYSSKNSLDVLYARALEHNALIVAGNKQVYNHEDGTTRQHDVYRFVDGMCRTCERSDVSGHTAHIFKTAFLRENNILYPTIRRREDPIFTARAYAHADMLYTVEFPVYTYRIEHKKYRPTVEALKEIIDSYALMLDIVPHQFNIWPSEHRVLLATLSESVFPLLHRSEGRQLWRKAQHILRAYPARYRFRSSSIFLVIFCILFRCKRGLALCMPQQWWEKFKKVACRLHLIPS